MPLSGEDDPVLVTGASGFIAKHVVLELLTAGYLVRGTVRSRDKADDVRRTMMACGADVSRLSFAVADLAWDDGWNEALAGCRFVHHTASPFPASTRGDKFALVPLAKGGTLRVMEAARRAGVSRVILTSSVAAVYYGHGRRGDEPFTAADFSDVESRGISAYAVSKTLAEQAAWDAVSGTPMQLVSINPALVLGPLLDRTYGTSVSMIRMMMTGRLPLVPRLSLGIVDVRDVAAAHLSAMTEPGAAGQRFLLSAGSRSLHAIGTTLAEDVPGYASRVPKATLPDFLVKAAAIFSTQARHLVNELGAVKTVDSTPAGSALGIAFRSPEEAIRATATGLIEHGLL